MSQDYKLKFDEMRSNEPGKPDDSLHGSDAHVRKLKFLWPNGKSKTMNYAYLISHDYDPALNQITFFYTSDTITIVGCGLEHLDELLFYNIPKKIEAVNPRYVALSKEKICVTDIIVEKKL
ncbi:hypothetical protein BEL04_18145 [Mucilaginibacter sp. PPCGB 2223]|uniref:hypothetical protein n=1 Tax=Mucilaginibacter sp. PPCGB 2223 TaxID=1886027 RepID=UPI000826086A|nr:hypothetical protein [Mucilaginibacter sp. PPCGB 2223]OCX51924.1 hypothetical protein BEL04_18145 [Mucilaginibacter sp. PPCGB 2223]